MTLVKVIIFVAALVTASAAAAQTSPETAPAPAPNYTYSPEGRRDPFVRTVGRSFATPSLSPNARPQGIPGLLVAEIVVRGFLESRGAWVAMVGAPDGRSYTLREGDRLMDGTVRAITSEAIVLLQEVKDPLSPAKQREVRKYLRGGEQVQ
jgi:Tfp pilus assembly protein PilP